jgi:hypothetical protein
VLVEWDEDKAAENQRKHRIGFDEAVTAIEDPLATTFPDPDHSADEYRFLTIGLSSFGRILMLWLTPLGRM